MFIVTGRARMLPDDVCTDHIISSHRKRDSSSLEDAVRYMFEDLTPPLKQPISAGDIIVAGSNFGFSSAMEIAAEIIRAAGVRAILARSFARTYYRNAVNLGLLALELDTGSISEGDELRVSLENGEAKVKNLTQNVAMCAAPVASFVADVISCGGLARYYMLRGEIPGGVL